MQKVGVILEINRKKAIVMTNRAEFITVTVSPGMFIGQQVDLNALLPKRFDIGKYRYSLGLISLTVFTIISLMTLTYYRSQSDLYAYLSVDINPSIEFTVNQQIQIISIRNINNDGFDLIKGINFKNMSIDNAIFTLVSKIEKDDFFRNREGKFILISAAVGRKSIIKSDTLKSLIDKLRPELDKRDVQLQFIKSTPAQRKMAMQKHLSMGRYQLMLRANNLGQSISPVEAKTAGIFELLSKAGMVVGADQSEDSAVHEESKPEHDGDPRFHSKSDAHILKKEDVSKDNSDAGIDSNSLKPENDIEKDNSNPNNVTVPVKEIDGNNSNPDAAVSGDTVEEKKLDSNNVDLGNSNTEYTGLVENGSENVNDDKGPGSGYGGLGNNDENANGSGNSGGSGDSGSTGSSGSSGDSGDSGGSDSSGDSGGSGGSGGR